jgi:hypothetical protein
MSDARPASTQADRSDAETEVRDHVHRLGNFYRLCLLAALVVTLTGVINVLTGSHRLWFLWVAFGFVVAIGFNALDTFGRRWWLGRQWEERKVREYLERHGR